MTEKILGRVRGVGRYYCWAQSTTEASLVADTTTFLPTTPLPLVGDTVLFANGDVRCVTSQDNALQVTCGEVLCNLKGAKGENGADGESATLAQSHANSLSKGSTQYAINQAFDRRNYIVNPCFKQNQRGQTVYTGVGYTVDNWKALTATSTLTVNDNGSVTMSGAYFEFEQVLEDNTPLLGKTCALSFFMNNSIYSASGAIGESAGEHCKKSLTSAGVQVFVRNNGANRLALVIRGNATNNCTVTWVKLEVGNCVTKYDNIVAGDDQLCVARYLQTVALNGVGVATSATNLQVALPLCQPMCKLPSLTVLSQPTVVGGGAFAVSAIEVVEIASNVALLNVTTSGLVQNNLYLLQGGKGLLSAEL